jgi:hypothetical protein
VDEERTVLRASLDEEEEKKRAEQVKSANPLPII